MSSQEFVPTVAGILMLVFGLALAAALFKFVFRALSRRRWPTVDATAKLGGHGGKRPLVDVKYAVNGHAHTLALDSGGLSSAALRGEKFPLHVNPNDPQEAVPAASMGNVLGMTFFALLSLMFGLFGLFTLVYVFTN